MNYYNHLTIFCDALSDPNPVVEKHLPRQLLKCCHSGFPDGLKGLLEDTILAKK